MDTKQELMTVEQFWELYAGKPYELINGQVVPIPPDVELDQTEDAVPTGADHADVEHLISLHLGMFVAKHKPGRIFVGEAGFQLGSDILVGADIAFVSNAKLAIMTDRSKFFPFAPDLVVEIVSPTDRATDIQHKINLYLEAGTPMVFVFYPDLRQVMLYTADGRSALLEDGDTLDGGDVLPGFSVPVSELFPPDSAQGK